jgi:hypothetical protein
MLLIIYRQGLFNSKHIMSDIIYTIMKKIFLFSITLFSVLIFFSCKTENSKSKAKSITSSSEIEISKTELLNKIKGGWAGQVIGCTYGGPTEFKWNGTMIDDHIPIPWDDTRMLWYYENSPGLYDDVYMDLTFVDVFRKYGIDAPDSLHAITFANAEYPLWHANQAARYNILSGIMPPESGYWKNNPHADDIDFQIEADFAGLMSPGMVNSAVEICNRIGRIMNYGDGLYGGMYVAAMYSLAFVHDDIEFIVEEALKVIPEQSDFYQCIYDVIKSYKSNPDDWKFAWFEAQKRWTHDIGCPDGVFMPFNIDAKINAAYIVIGLLYVKGDFDIAPMYSFDDRRTIAAHFSLGVAIPYGNSDILPFEKRYFGGGANSVRGWSTRTLGPGTYSADSALHDFGNKVGEVKLDFSVEYRRKITKLIELAGFVDAGNIWTIKDYVDQPGGLFSINDFYKELGVAYGVGVRLDLNFLLLRLDFGMKAHNPALPIGSRWTVFKPDIGRDLAFHFAIGYPF